MKKITKGLLVSAGIILATGLLGNAIEAIKTRGEVDPPSDFAEPMLFDYSLGSGKKTKKPKPKSKPKYKKQPKKLKK
jgi:hypothetical protein